jgi:hypothetical protein
MEVIYAQKKGSAAERPVPKPRGRR